MKFYIIQIILGVKELHKNRIIHRDLKPENVMVDEDGYLKIIDFGMSLVIKTDELA